MCIKAYSKISCFRPHFLGNPGLRHTNNILGCIFLLLHHDAQEQTKNIQIDSRHTLSMQNKKWIKIF